MVRDALNDDLDLEAEKKIPEKKNLVLEERLK